MASKLIQFRLSGEVLGALEAQVREGDSINLVAQRILTGALGVDHSVNELYTPNLNERIEAVEDNLSSFTGNVNDLFSRLQERIEALESQVVTLSQTSQTDSTTFVDSGVHSVDSLEECHLSESPVVYSAVDSVDDSLTGKELAERLGVDPGTLTKNRTKPTFGDWSRDKDPEGKAWQYLSRVKRYSPIPSTASSTVYTGDINQRP